MWSIILLFFVTCTWADNSINSRNYSPINCIELKAQEDLALDKVQYILIKKLRIFTQ